MRKRLLCLILSAVLALGIAPATSLAKTADGPDYGKPGTDYVEGEAIVCVKGRAALSKSLKRDASFQMETLMKIKPDKGAGARTAGLSSSEKSLVLVTSDKKDTKALIETFEKDPNVEYAEPNYIMKAYDLGTPSDSEYKYQWGLYNRENASNPSNAANPAVDGHFKEAWSKSTTPSENPVVAVIDSGVDYNHPDLKEVMWNDGETIPALKEMGGGTYGYNARSPVENSRDPMDQDVGHGTHCAGIIAAEWNSEGVAGVNPNVEIMALRFLGSTNAGSVSDALKCYAYVQTAVEKGVKVSAINNSWGPTNYDDYQLRSISTAANAIGEQYGVVSCFAAGNDGVDLDKNTAGAIQGPYMIEVGAMDSTGSAAFFSQYGKETVDVFAPGTQILSTTTTNTEKMPMKEHDMPVQYLPQIMGEDDSWFYEDFESSKDDQVSLRLLDKNGDVVVSAAEALSPGYTSDKGLQLPLNAIKEGENFFIEMTIPASAVSAVTADDVYLAFQAGCDNAMYGGSFDIQCQDASGEWKVLFDRAQVIGKDEFFPARLRLTDHNWNQATLQIEDKDTSFLRSEEALTLRLTPRTKKMQGRQEGKEAAFRLDDVGLGKKASNYYYSDGTSMATPMVTGLAGLLASNGYEGEEIAARIRGGVNRADAQGLKNKSVSDGFIDAAAALDKTAMKCVPVLNNLSVNGDTASLTGYFFGDTQGTLTIGGKSATVSEWTDRKITFQIPDGIRGKQEIRIVRSGTKASTDYGKNYFSVSPDTVGYKALSAPKLTYGSYDGKYQFTSEDLVPISMAAAGGKIAWLGMLQEENQFFLELYDVASDTWEKASLPEDLQAAPNLTEAYQLAGGKEKLYLSYFGAGIVAKIGVYDTKSKTWRTVKTELKTELPGLEALAVYRDQLIAAGGQEDKGTSTDVRVIDPDTGKVIGSLPNLPEPRAGAKLCASGNLLILYGGYDDYMAKLQGGDYTQYANALVYDGTKWTENENKFFSAEFEGGFDEEQTLDYAVGATNSGLLVAGPVQNWETEKVDTWAFDSKTGDWSARKDVLYSQYKTTCDLGVTYDGAFYVRSRGDLEENPIVFRALTNVDYTGPTGEPAKDKETPPSNNSGNGQQIKPADKPSAVNYTANRNALNKKIKAAWSKKGLKVTWGRTKGADGYEVYAAANKNKYAKVKTVKGAKKTSCVIKKIKGKKLNPAKCYKVAVRAYRVVNGKKQYLGTSLSVYAVGKNNKTYTNPKSVKVAKKSLTLRKGKSKKISAKVTKQSSKKKLLKACSKVRYFSTNPKVATVTAKTGKIKAKSKGSCTIWAVAANGVKTKVKVKVK